MTPADEQPRTEASFPTVGRWLVTDVPRGWTFALNFGIRQFSEAPGNTPANVALAEDRLAEPDGLARYVEAQVAMIAQHLANPAIAGPQPTTFAGADEASLLFLRHVAPNGVLMLHAQTYVRQGLWLGILTLTTPESAFQSVRPSYDAFVKGLRIPRADAAV